MAEPVSTSVVLFIKKVVIDFAKKLITKPSHTLSKVMEICALAITPVVLVGLLTVGLLTKMPSFFVKNDQNSNDITKKQIQEFVKLENEIESIAKAHANQMADDLEKSIKTEYETPTPSITPAYSNKPGMTPAPTTTTIVKFERNIEVTTPTWRVLLALATVYNAQDFELPSTNYVRGIVTNQISYSSDVQKETSEGVITYTITVDSSCQSVYDLAKLITSNNTELKDDEKCALADGYYDFLCYFDNKGNQLKRPYFDVSNGGDLSGDYPVVTAQYCISMPYFNQGDPKWNYANGEKLILYEPDRTVQTSGCGPTSMAMVIWGLAADKNPALKTSINPVTVFNYAIKYGYYKGNGTYPALFSSIGKEYGIKVEFWRATAERIVNAIQKGHPVIAHVGVPGTEFPHGHYLVIKGATPDGKVIINDPGAHRNTVDSKGNPVLWDVNVFVRSAAASYAECSLEGD
jgi:hypothetical protein